MLGSPAGEEEQAQIDLRLDDPTLQGLAASFDAACRRNFTLDEDGAAPTGPQPPAPADPLHRLGEELFRTLLGGEAGRLWWRSVGDREPPATPLRLVLQIQLDDADAARLHSLPWECLHPGGARLPLLLTSPFSLVRYVSQHGTPDLPPKPDLLRVLAVSSDVAGSAGGRPHLPPLDLDAELAALERELEVAGVELAVERDPPPDELDDLLERHEPHVLHLLGHGDFTAGGGAVYLCERDGIPRAVDADTLARLLEPCPTLRLVVLNTCAGARACHRAPFAGLAPALIRKAGVPAVVAMQRPISDAGAARFAAALYRRLAAGASLDRAVHHGRRQLANSAEWATPVLFSRLEGGHLFAAEPAPGSLPALLPAALAERWRRWSGWAAVWMLLVCLAVVGAVGAVSGPWSAPQSAVPVTPLLSSRPSAEPTVYHLRDGDRVWVEEIGSHVSVRFETFRTLRYPILHHVLSGDTIPVESARPVEFSTPAGTVVLQVIDVGDDGVRFTVPSDPGPLAE